MKSIIIALALALTGCTSMLTYAPSPDWEGSTLLGPVQADSGKWPLSLNTPPPEYTYQKALKVKASKQYGVPESEIVLSEISVKIGSEMVGTVRDWKATATAGRKIK